MFRAGALGQLPGNRDAVIREYETALRLKPDLMEAHYNLALALSFIPGRMPDAIAHLEAAQRLDLVLSASGADARRVRVPCGAEQAGGGCRL